MGELTHTVGGDSNLVSFRSAARVPITSLKVHFSPKQLGEGTPSPENVREIVGWDGVEVTRCGKNLIDEAFLSDASNYTVTGAYGYTYTDYIQLVPNTKYRFVWFDYDSDKISGSLNLYCDGAGEYIVSNGAYRQYTSGFTTKATGKIRFAIYKSSAYATNQDALDDIFGNGKLLLQIGVEDTSYEPYQGQTLPITFPVLGKNKFPASDGAVSDIFLAANTTYTFSATSPSVGYFKGWYEDETDTGLIWINAGEDGNRRWKTFTPEKNIIKGIFYVGTGMSKCQIELGSTATTYEPYDSNNTVYGGYVDLVTGEVWETWTAVDMGTIDWLKSSSGNKFYVIGLSRDYPWQSDLTMYCPIYKFDGANVSSTYYGADGTIRYYYRANGNSREIYVHDERFDNAADFKAAMNGIPLVYPLATPQLVATLTPTQLTTLLDRNNIWSNTNGPTSVSYAIHDSAMIRAAKRRIANFDATKKMNVPPNYREVEWIGAENASPYIRTGILSCVNLKANIVFYKDCDEAFLFGARNSIGNRQYNVNIMSGAPHTFRVDLGTGNGGDVKLNVPDTGGAGKFEIQIDLPNAIVTYADGSTYTVTTSSTNVYAGEYGDVLLFAVRTANNINNGVNNGVLRIYSAKFWEFDKLVRDFVPCIRKSDNVAGMYDRVTKQFFTSANSDTFTIPT